MKNKRNLSHKQTLNKKQIKFPIKALPKLTDNFMKINHIKVSNIYYYKESHSFLKEVLSCLTPQAIKATIYWEDFVYMCEDFTIFGQDGLYK